MTRSLETDLEFPPGIEFLQALHRLLSVHHRRHCGALLAEVKETGDEGILGDYPTTCLSNMSYKGAE